VEGKWQSTQYVIYFWDIPPSGSIDRIGFLALRLNFDRATHEEEIWIVLTRHVTNTQASANFISLNVQLEEEAESVSGVSFSAAISPMVCGGIILISISSS
jgi:hypothetical protein